MRGQVYVSDDFTLSQMGERKWSWEQLWRTVKAGLRSQRRLAALICLILLLTLTGTFFQGAADTGFSKLHLTSQGTPASGSGSNKLPAGAGQATVNAAASQPKSPAQKTCPTSEQNSNVTLFARCPGFLVNFAAQRNGSVNTQFFNVYSGQPEANDEAEFYTSNQQNLRIENGSLVLAALNDPQQGYNYTSGRVDTNGKENFQYGKLTIRATLPAGVGTWPAIWMLPASPKYAASTDLDRYLNNGEIDVAESIGTQPHVVYGIAHSRAYPPDGPNRGYYSTTVVPGNDQTFHDYELDWTPTNLTFSVDGQPYFSISKQPGATYYSWPYDQPYYLIINLALGGSWGGTDTSQFPPDGINKAALPAAMQIQSIKYYPYVGQ